jgi:hypothetical protein
MQKGAKQDGKTEKRSIDSWANAAAFLDFHRWLKLR